MNAPDAGTTSFLASGYLIDSEIICRQENNMPKFQHANLKKEIFLTVLKLIKLVKRYITTVANTPAAVELENALIHLPSLTRALHLPKEDT